MASHIALSTLFALFPFLIFATSIAGFFELSGFADTVIHLIFDYWPEAAGEPLAREVRSILTVGRIDSLTIGGVLTLYFASNGVEAIRVALNRAYGRNERRPFWWLRLQSILFVFVAIFALMVIALALVLLPLGWSLAERYVPDIVPWQNTVWMWRFLFSLGILFAALYISHKYLPSGQRRLSTLLPGILFTLFFWMASSVAFGFYLGRFADYVSTYAGLAGAMMGLVFLYMLGLIFIFGGEINAAIYRQRTTPNKSTEPGQ